MGSAMVAGDTSGSASGETSDLLGVLGSASRLGK
jgi:hypothetical protein